MVLRQPRDQAVDSLLRCSGRPPFDQLFRDGLHLVLSKDHEPTVDLVLLLVQFINELDDNSKVRATATDPIEKVWILIGTGCKD